MNDRPSYPWSQGDALFADELNAAIANAGAATVVPPGGSIQAAIDALPATGGEVSLSANTTYVITAAMSSTKPNVRLSAPSWSAVIQRGPALSGTVLQLNGSGCLIEGMTFDGNGAVNATAIGAAEASITGMNSRITDCQFVNSSATMNVSCAGAGCRVDHCTITGRGVSLSTERGFGIWAVNNVQVFLEHNRITSTGIEAIGINGPGSVANGNIISRCHCWSGGGGGQLWSYPNTVSEAGTVVSNNYIGQGQHISSGGIELSGNNVTCTGNTIVNQYGGGIQLNGGHGFTITGNTILNTGLDMSGAQDGIVVLAGVTDFVITGNRVADDQATPTMRWAVGIQAGASDRYVITGNLFSPVNQANNCIADGGTGVVKVIRDNTGVDTIVPINYSAAALSIGTPWPVSHLWNGGVGTITSITAASAARGSMRVLLPDGPYVFQAGNNINNTVTTAANVPLIMACDENGKWWLR